MGTSCRVSCTSQRSRRTWAFSSSISTRSSLSRPHTVSSTSLGCKRRAPSGPPGLWPPPQRSSMLLSSTSRARRPAKATPWTASWLSKRWRRSRSCGSCSVSASRCSRRPCTRWSSSSSSCLRRVSFDSWRCNSAMTLAFSCFSRRWFRASARALCSRNCISAKSASAWRVWPLKRTKASSASRSLASAPSRARSSAASWPWSSSPTFWASASSRSRGSARWRSASASAAAAPAWARASAVSAPWPASRE
mmetsp:Transcript_76671/g.248182  ORF Transcript_76671/g.248182 Transcript_76671/m.248182 type:complete len:250 (-) Transcript_76671:709-1458(-)